MRHAGNDQQGRNVVKPYDRAFIACIYRMWHLYSHRTKHTHQVGPGLVRRRLTDALMCGDQIRSTAGFRVSKEVLVDQKGPSLPANSAEAGSFAYSSLTYSSKTLVSCQRYHNLTGEPRRTRETWSSTSQEAGQGSSTPHAKGLAYLVTSRIACSTELLKNHQVILRRIICTVDLPILAYSNPLFKLLFLPRHRLSLFFLSVSTESKPSTTVKLLFTGKPREGRQNPSCRQFCL